MTHISLSGAFSFKDKLLVLVSLLSFLCLSLFVCVCLFICVFVYVCVCILALTCLKVNESVFVKSLSVSIHLIESIFFSHYRNLIIFHSKLQSMMKLFTKAKHDSNLIFLFLGMEGEATNKWHRTISSPVEFLSGVRLLFLVTLSQCS